VDHLGDGTIILKKITEQSQVADEIDGADGTGSILSRAHLFRQKDIPGQPDPCFCPDNLLQGGTCIFICLKVLCLPVEHD